MINSQQNHANINRSFISKNETSFGDNPYKFFKKPMDPVGITKMNNKYYLIKMIPLSNEMLLDNIPEVQIMDANLDSTFLPHYVDYIIEQHEFQDSSIDKAVFIVMEMVEDDLYSFIKKKGPLELLDLLKLLESLVSVNYDLQKQLEVAHGDLKPSNILVKIDKDASSGQQTLHFFLSFFDNNNYMVINNNSFIDSLAYKSPELLLSTLVSTNYMNNTIGYKPSQELKTILEKSGDEVKFNPFRSDTFSLGLVLLYACTGFQFVLRKITAQEEVYRDGAFETDVLNSCLNEVKKRYNFPPLIEILRLLLGQNPFNRYDFEELAFRLNKLNQYNKAVPHIEVEGHNVVPMEDHETLKENYWELQEMVEDLQQKIRDLESTVQSMKDDHKTNKKTTFTGNFGNTSKNILNDLSSIMRDQPSSFLSDSMNKEYSIIKEGNEESTLEDEERINNQMSNIFKKFDLKQNNLSVEFAGNSDEEIVRQAQALKEFLCSSDVVTLEGIELLGLYNDKGFELLREGFLKANTIKILIINLRGTITDTGLKSLSSGLLQVKTIEFLNIDVTTVLTITEKGLDFLCQGIRIWSNLKDFNISLNALNPNYGRVDISKEKSSSLEQRLLNEHKNVRKVAINVNWRTQDGQFENENS